MIKKILLLIIIISFEICSQPVSSHYYKLWQKDSLYYVLTDKGLLKFYSPGTSGDFYLTNYFEGNFTSSMSLALNDNYLLFKRGDSVDVYSNDDAFDLSYESTFVPGYVVSGIYGFGPYIFIRTENKYNLLKIVGGHLESLEDTLFSQPSQELVFFVYPYVVIAQSVYKYVEGFDFYAVGQANIGNGNTGQSNDTLIAYYYWVESLPPYTVHNNLNKYVIEEPDFPTFSYPNWGLNIQQIHHSFGWGTMIAKEHLYYMMWVNTITTSNSQLAYQPSQSDVVYITDNYIFLLGDSVRYSKWYAGSTFYPFTWTNITNVKNQSVQPSSFTLYQNYPNPFNPTTKIKYQLPEFSNVKLTIYDVLGRQIKTLVNQEKPAGNYEVEFDGTGLPSGVYFYRIEAGKFSDTKKFVLMK